MGLVKVVGILIDLIFGISEYLDITRLHNLIGKYHICQTLFVKMFNYFLKRVEVFQNFECFRTLTLKNKYIP